MTNNKLLLATGVAALSAGFFSTAATSATDAADASATILAPLTITADVAAEMDFGDISPDIVATSVIMDSAGGRTSLDGAGIFGGTPLGGNFDVTGAGTLAYDITLPMNGVVTLGGPGVAMAVDDFTDSVGGSTSLVLGTSTFDVGATLKLNANQAVGLYTGTYAVTVNYQ
jgi:hypothetical protein